MTLQGERHPYRVHVSGLAKTVVHRHDGRECYDEEYEIGDFFHTHGCDVSWVSLLVDKRSGRSRGFAFVDFDNQEAFEKACALDGMDHPPEIHLDEKCGGKIQVSSAKPSDDTVREQHLELTKERNRTDGLEKEMRLCAARINEKMRQIQAQRERQLALQKTKHVEEEVHNQRSRQKEIEVLMSELHAMEASLTRELKAERGRTQALEDLRADVHWDEEHHEYQEHQEHHAAHSAPRTEESAGVLRALIVPEAEALHRKITVRSSGPESTKAAPPPASALEPPRSGSSLWLAKREEKHEAMKRAAGVGHDASRATGQDSPRQPGAAAVPRQQEPHQPRRGVAPHREQPEEHEGPQSPPPAVTSTGGVGAGRRDVLIRNLPVLPQADLEAELKREFSRLWRAAGRTVPPEVASIKVAKRETAYGRSNVEAVVVFTDPYNAWLLVEHCRMQEWSSSATPTLHGQVLQVEWRRSAPPAGEPESRRDSCRADAEASSQMTHNASCAASSRSGGAALAAGRGSLGKGSGDFAPPQRRAVIVAGIPTTMHEDTVKVEVLTLLQRLYPRGNFNLDPRASSHRSLDSLEVSPPASRQDENGGSVRLRFQSHTDAVWLVEQASGLKIAGAKLKAFWEQPRSPRDTGNARGAGSRVEQPHGVDTSVPTSCGTGLNR